MNIKFYLIIFYCFFSSVILSQVISINPYLQNASYNSMIIMWELSEYTDSYIEWGETQYLDNITYASNEITNYPAVLFKAELNNLNSSTKYYYRVFYNNTSTDIFSFKTPSIKSEEKSINLVAMSDMQANNNTPNKFSEIVNDGIIRYVDSVYDGDICENLHMILIPGDLVVTGTDYFQWRDDFFAQSEPIFSSVPFYPVLGNHEYNADFYFQFFDLPHNGTDGYEEHWWYKDNSNVRIIGLNSNSEYQIQEQLHWLDSILILTSMDTNIDFVFAQLHHPHRSELWTPGNTDFTGDVISLLENFSTNSGKPSIHFYGHTHGYSRGQSRDHNHLMVNVATAGGYIDYWGEYPQEDYEEYSISQDEWGYVFVEVKAGDDPYFVLKRFSVGDDLVSKNNSLEDSIVIRLNNLSPSIPEPIYPLFNDTVDSDCFELKSSEFYDEDGDLHGSTHWQISDDCNDFSDNVFDSWKQYENWYFDENTQLNDDLTDEMVYVLNADSDYCWRVRYRDRSLSWSEWSSPIYFHTDSSDDKSFKLLPNPLSESAILKLPFSNNSDVKVVVYSIDGAILQYHHDFSNSVFKFNRNGLSEGIYIMRIIVDGIEEGLLKFGIIDY